jgi:hypothetical protein
MLDITPDTTVDASAPDSAEAETFETPGDLDEPVLPEADDADLPEEEAAEEEPVVPEVKAADDLPEGVKKGKDRSGKDGLFVEPKRWETIHGNHKLVQEVSNIIGEPATLPALQLREQAYQAQEMLFNDLTSGDPASQQKVANYFLDQMQQARDSGEVGVDPTVPFAQTIYSALKEKSPDAFANLRLMGARDLATEIFDAAAKSGDADLFTSMQHVVRALTGAAKGTDSAGVRALAEKMGIPFHARSEMENLARGADPVALLRQQNAALQAQLNGRTSNNQAAQFGDWQKQTNTAIEQGIASDAVQPALASVAEAWKSFPAEYKTHVVDALHSKVDEIVRADPNLKAKITSLQSRAKSATSAQARNDIAAQIRTAYVNRAKLATDAALRPVLDSANKILTGLSNSNHARRSAAQGRTAPTRGAQGSVNRSITPDAGMPGGIFDPSVAVRQGLAAFR